MPKNGAVKRKAAWTFPRIGFAGGNSSAAATEVLIRTVSAGLAWPPRGEHRLCPAHLSITAH